MAADSLSSRRLPLSRAQVQLLSWAVICAILASSFALLGWRPRTWWGWGLDLVLRSWLGFLGTVMSHEASHGLLGGRRGNLWWGRLALLPVMVPFASFRKTHLLHHVHTNEPDLDPDHFVRPGRSWELPFRALAMPHQWLFWLKRRGKLTRGHLLELAFDYGLIALVFCGVGWWVGPWRLVLGMAPVLLAVSLILWVPFAYKTHEGFSLGAADTRSHNYYGLPMYWLTLGLSMHRVHHEKPRLSWLELLPYVERAPGGGWLPRRDIRREPLA